MGRAGGRDGNGTGGAGGARDLPHDLGAEQAVLGAILAEPTAFDDVAAQLAPGDFHVPAHQHLFAVVTELVAESLTPDPILVNQRLAAKGLLPGVVPHELAFSLSRALGTPGNLHHYARIVRDLSRLRTMIRTTERLSRAGHDAAGAVQDYLERAQQEVLGAVQGEREDTLRRANEPVLRALEQLEEDQRRIASGASFVTGVATGFPTLDRQTMGLQPGALVIVAARPSVGKTAFALSLAAHAAVRGERRVAFFSLEMPAEQLSLRLLAAEAHLDLRRLRQRPMSRHEWEKIAAHGERLGRAALWFDDTFVLSPVELRSKCRRIRRETGLDLVVIDYLQLMHAPGDRMVHSREQEIATISRSLKALAKELEVPVVALSQLSRAVEKRKGKDAASGRPVLSDLRESGAIEQDADVVMFLHRPGDAENADEEARARAGETQELELIIAKQRQGPIGMIPLVFFMAKTLFVERVPEARAP